jgi:hypothetical protein
MNKKVKFFGLNFYSMFSFNFFRGSSRGSRKNEFFRKAFVLYFFKSRFGTHYTTGGYYLSAQQKFNLYSSLFSFSNFHLSDLSNKNKNLLLYQRRSNKRAKKL